MDDLWILENVYIDENTALIRSYGDEDKESSNGASYLPSVFCFRFTDIKAVEDDPEGDKFQVTFEVLNWTDTPASGVRIVLNTSTNRFAQDATSTFAGAGLDSNDCPLGHRSSILRNRVSRQDIDEISAFPQKKPGFLTDALEHDAKFDSDYYRFNLNAPEKLEFAIRGLSADANVELLNSSNGVSIRSVNGGTNDEFASIDNLSPGNYAVRVYSASGDTDYELTLNLDQAGNSRANDRDLGTLTDRSEFGDYGFRNFVGSNLGDEVDYYRLRLDRPRLLTFALRELSADADVYLEDANGNVLQSSTNGDSEDEIGDENLAENTTYYIRVDPFSNNSTNYQLVINPREEANPSLSFQLDNQAVTQGATTYFPVTNISVLAGTDNGVINGHAGDDLISIADFILRLRQLTGAQIAASTHPVGYASLGGSWHLEYAIGNVSAGLALMPEVMDKYPGVFGFKKAVTDPSQRPKLSFSQGSYQVNEDGTVVGLAVTIDRTEITTGRATVEVELTDDSATGGEDFDNTIQTIAFADSETSKTVVIPITDDDLVEGDENLTLTLVNPIEGGLIGAQSTATLKIVDNDVPQDDSGGNDITEASTVLVSSIARSISNWVGSADPDDYYKFSLGVNHGFNLSLHGLSADANLELLDSNGNIIASSTNPGKEEESLSSVLGHGTYYVRVYSVNEANTLYDLNISFTPLLPGISTGGSDAPIYTGAEPIEIDVASELVLSPDTAQSSSLIGMDAFRADPRFAGIDGSGYSIVIIDTGIDLDHPFFGPDNDNDGVADRIVYHFDFAESDADATDVDGHGSNVSSIAVSSDGTHTGMAPGADIIHLKVFEDNGNGSFSYIEQALQWVLANANTYNIASVNISLSNGKNYSTPQQRNSLDDELAQLAEQNIIVASSSGNRFFTHNSDPGVAYPSADPNALSVGAVYDSNVGGRRGKNGDIAFSSEADRIAPFSQRHETLTTIFAPGAAITGANADGGTNALHGTSQAAPHIAGIAALAQQLAQRELGRELTPTEFSNLLRSTAVTINDGDDENDNVQNTGLDFKRVDMLALVEEIFVNHPPVLTIPILQQSPDEAETLTAEALSLPSDFPISDFDPVAATEDNVEGAAAFFAEMIKVQNTVTQIASLIDGASDATTGELSPAVLAAIASEISAGGTLDLSDAQPLEAIIQDAATEAQAIDPNLDLNGILNVASEAAQIVAESNQRIDRAAENNTGSDITTEVARVQKVTMGDTSSDLKEVTAGTLTIEEVVAENTGDALDAKIAAALVYSAAPTDIELTNSEVAENQPVGTAVGSFSTIDTEAGETHTYSLVAGEGDSDNDSFEIIYNILQILASFDYETKDEYSIRVQTAGDIITGFQGRDTLSGGAGSDQFVYSSIFDGGDIITDLQVDSDKIVLTDVLNSLGHSGSDQTDSYISFASRGGYTTLLLDTNGTGSGRARPFILLENVVLNDFASRGGDKVEAQMSATDPGADTISFFLDGSLISTDTHTSGTREASTDLGTFPNDGTFSFSARSRDSDGADSNTRTQTLTVNNVAPTITSLTEDLSIGTNNTFSFAATATDPGLTDILTYEWDLDGDGNFDDFTGSSGEWSFSEPGDHEVKLRVSDGDGGVDEDSFTVTAVEPNLPEPYSFRFTDIKAVSDDLEGDKFQFSFEIINWTDTPVRSPHEEVTNPDALFINTSLNHPESTCILKELEELFYNNVTRCATFYGDGGFEEYSIAGKTHTGSLLEFNNPDDKDNCTQQLKIATDYLSLAMLPELSDSEADRLEEILELAQFDDDLSSLINKIDCFVLEELKYFEPDELEHDKNQIARIKEFLVSESQHDDRQAGTAENEGLAFSAWPRIAESSNDVNLAPEALAATQQWVVNVRSEQSSSELAALLGAIELGETGHIANTYIWEFPEDADPKEVASQLSSRVEVGFAYPLVPLQL